MRKRRLITGQPLRRFRVSAPRPAVPESGFSAWARALILADSPRSLYFRGPWGPREFVNWLSDLVVGDAPGLTRRTTPELLRGVRLRWGRYPLAWAGARRSIRRGMDPVVAAVYWRLDPRLVHLLAPCRVIRREVSLPLEGQLSLLEGWDPNPELSRLLRYCRR